jgi:hypothetical protein
MQHPPSPWALANKNAHHPMHRTRAALTIGQRSMPTRATGVRVWNIDRLLLVWLYRLYP